MACETTLTISVERCRVSKDPYGSQKKGTASGRTLLLYTYLIVTQMLRWLPYLLYRRIS
ncbi:MAG: hypothetical protein RI947_165 [Candidatus Parcubacteria bacterium]|jgi:hypothetical protein